MFQFKLTKRSFRIISDSMDVKESFKCFRQCSSAYISNKEVKKYIFLKYNNECNYCKSNKDLQIDHIISVKKCFTNKQYFFCNSIENLQLLCRKCNASKLP